MDIDRLVDRLGAHAHLWSGREVLDQSVTDLLRRPLHFQFRLHAGTKSIVGEQLRLTRSGVPLDRESMRGVGMYPRVDTVLSAALENWTVAALEK